MYLEAVLEITLQASNILRTKCTENQNSTQNSQACRIIKLAKHKEASWEQCHLLLYIPSLVQLSHGFLYLKHN